MEIICKMNETDILTAINFWLTEHKGLNIKEQPVIDYQPGSGNGAITAICILDQPVDPDGKEVVKDAGV